MTSDAVLCGFVVCGAHDAVRFLIEVHLFVQADGETVVRWRYMNTHFSRKRPAAHPEPWRTIGPGDEVVAAICKLKHGRDVSELMAVIPVSSLPGTLAEVSPLDIADAESVSRHGVTVIRRAHSASIRTN